MVYTNLKNTAMALRKQGLSFSEIKEKVPVSKATLSGWFKEIKLAPVHRARLKQKRTEALKRASEKKIAQTLIQIEEIQKSSKGEIRKISKRELWLIGVVLYWKNGNKNDLKKGVHFTSADPDQIKLFLKWTQEIGGLKREEFGFDIFISEHKNSEEAVDYWSEVTDFSKDFFTHIYRQKNKKAKSRNRKSEQGREIQENSSGFLRVRVRASSMLARQISGWINGLKDILNKS